MKTPRHILCDWCIKPIKTGNKKVRVLKKNGEPRILHFHNRHIHDCYVQWKRHQLGGER